MSKYIFVPLCVIVSTSLCAIERPKFKFGKSLNKRAQTVHQYLIDLKNERNVNRRVQFSMGKAGEFDLSTPQEFNDVLDVVEMFVKLVAKSPYVGQLMRPVMLQLSAAKGMLSGVASRQQVKILQRYPTWTTLIPVNWCNVISKSLPHYYFPVWVKEYIDMALMFSTRNFFDFLMVDNPVGNENRDKLVAYGEHLSSIFGLSLTVELAKTLRRTDFDNLSRFRRLKGVIEKLVFAVHSEKLVNLHDSKIKAIIGKRLDLTLKGGNTHLPLGSSVGRIQHVLLMDALAPKRPKFIPDVFLREFNSEKNEDNIEHYARELNQALNMANVTFRLSHFDYDDIDIQLEFDSMLDIVESLAIKIARKKLESKKAREALEKNLYIRLIPRYLVARTQVVAFKNPKKRGPDGYIVIDYNISCSDTRFKEREVVKDFIDEFILKVALNPQKEHKIYNCQLVMGSL